MPNVMKKDIQILIDSQDSRHYQQVLPFPVNTPQVVTLRFINVVSLPIILLHESHQLRPPNQKIRQNRSLSEHNTHI